MVLGWDLLNVSNISVLSLFSWSDMKVCQVCLRPSTWNANKSDILHTTPVLAFKNTHIELKLSSEHCDVAVVFGKYLTSTCEQFPQNFFNLHWIKTSSFYCSGSRIFWIHICLLMFFWKKCINHIFRFVSRYCWFQLFHLSGYVCFYCCFCFIFIYFVLYICLLYTSDAADE